VIHDLKEMKMKKRKIKKKKMIKTGNKYTGIRN